MAARVLLIEDDASIARFVALALRELPKLDVPGPAVELTAVYDLASARAALATGGWQLVISDLMLPDGSAEALLDEGLAVAPGAPPWVVFSAGLREDRRLALAERGVARLLRKPVPLAELLGTVSELLAAAAAPAPETPTAASEDPVDRHFGGDRALYDTFRAGCIERFADDLAAGDAALAAGDAQALRRVAHGLKAVLELIGQPALAARARALEDAAAAGEPVAAGWAGLADGLVGLGARR
jgi:DNA-binding response OmpR family regulator